MSVNVSNAYKYFGGAEGGGGGLQPEDFHELVMTGGYSGGAVTRRYNVFEGLDMVVGNLFFTKRSQLFEAYNPLNEDNVSVDITGDCEIFTNVRSFTPPSTWTETGWDGAAILRCIEDNRNPILVLHNSLTGEKTTYILQQKSAGSTGMVFAGNFTATGYDKVLFTYDSEAHTWSSTRSAENSLSQAVNTLSQELAGKQKTINIVTGTPIILDANGNMDLKISDGSFLDDVAQIGDKQYKVGLMPDGKIWMCENLDYGRGGVYYDNDEATYGWNGLKYGKLYAWDEAVAVGNAISGWHLPSADEWDALATAVGGAGVAGTKLKSTTGWSSGNGDGSYDFAAFPAGSRNSGSFNNLGVLTFFWTATESDSSIAYDRCFNTGASMVLDSSTKVRYAYSVRLVKD